MNRRTVITMVKATWRKGQAMVYKTLNRKLIEQDMYIHPQTCYAN
jgi:hypothetical protein